MKNPLVTVVIPAYNAEKYIGECLDSILKQTMHDFEVLVIDDGSTDGTGDVVKDLAKKDERIKYIKQKNMGVARTRNMGVGLAKGEFIAFMDNDDFIDRDYLEKLLPKKDEDVVICGFKRPDENGKIVKEMRLKDARWSKFMNPTPWAKVYRKSFIIDNKLEFLDNNIGEDIYFNLIGMLVAERVRIIDYTGYNWFYNRASVSSTAHKDFKKIDIFKLLNSCYDELKKRDLLQKNYELLEFFFYRFIVWFLLYATKGQKKEAIDDIYDKLFVWLEERFPEFTDNKLLKRGQLEGEEKKTRIAYELFLRAYKIGLGKSLIWAYARV